MDNAIYITAAHQLALTRDMDVTANNIANMNTPGFDASHNLFTSYLFQDGPRGNVALTNDISTYRDTAAGSARETGNALDLAIGGEGYFIVDTPQGRRYTRAGNFQIDANSTLVTQEGYPVLDVTGQRILFTPQDKAITIGALGNLQVDGQDRSQIAVVNFANPQDMKRMGERMYSTDQVPQPADNPRVMQGTLENSNVQPVIETTHMLEVSRSFEDAAKLVQIFYDVENQHTTSWTQQTNG